MLIRAETSTPTWSAVSASPRCAWSIQTTYEPLSNDLPLKDVLNRSVSTSMPLRSSQSTRRLASALDRWPFPTGTTYALGKSFIQLLSTSNGGGQQAGRGSSSTPRR